MLKTNNILNALVVLVGLLVIAGIITMTTMPITSMYVWIGTFIVSMVTLNYYHKES